MQTETAYFTRAIHGGHRVRRLAAGALEVEWPSGWVQYPSIKKTLIAVVNNQPVAFSLVGQPASKVRDPKMGFDRYFRVASTQVSVIQEGASDTLRLFSPLLAVPDHKQVLKTTDAISITSGPSVTNGVLPLGIDLVRRGHEVAKLFYAGFARSVIRYGYNPEDVLQEVYKGLLIRNNGSCPWDAKKSSFGHYVHLVIKCILVNYHRRWARLLGPEQIGVMSRKGELVDVASADLEVAANQDSAEYNLSYGVLLGRVDEAAVNAKADLSLTREVAQKLAQGFRKSEINALYAGAHRPYQIERAIHAVLIAAQTMRDQPVS